jgi:hypothetical protein
MNGWAAMARASEPSRLASHRGTVWRVCQASKSTSDVSNRNAFRQTGDMSGMKWSRWGHRYSTYICFLCLECWVHVHTVDLNSSSPEKELVTLTKWLDSRVRYLSLGRLLYSNTVYCFKGSLTRNFRVLFFSTNQFSPPPWITYWNHFQFFQTFANMLKSKG